MTGLRTMWGCSRVRLDELMPEWERANEAELQKLQSDEMINLTSDKLIITDKGKIMADHIMSQLFVTKQFSHDA